MTQSIKGTRAALLTALQTIFTGQVDGRGKPVQVTLGKPGVYQADYIVAVMNTRRPIQRPTMGTSRSRHSDAEIDVLISCYVPGAENVQSTALDACDDLTALIEAYFRTSPQETFGGACMEAWVSGVDGSNPEVVTDPKSKSVTGRLAYSTVTVTARIRY